MTITAEHGVKKKSADEDIVNKRGRVSSLSASNKNLNILVCKLCTTTVLWQPQPHPPPVYFLAGLSFLFGNFCLSGHMVWLIGLSFLLFFSPHHYISFSSKHANVIDSTDSHTLNNHFLFWLNKNVVKSMCCPLLFNLPLSWAVIVPNKSGNTILFLTPQQFSFIGVSNMLSVVTIYTFYIRQQKFKEQKKATMEMKSTAKPLNCTRT